MLWLIVAISGYFILALVNVIDKYLLKSRIPEPSVYAFYVGAMGVFVFLLAPFGFLEIPAWPVLIFALLGGAFNIFAILVLFKGLKAFEASRIIPAIGALLPIFTFSFTAFSGYAERVLGASDAAAFILLISGTILITYRKNSPVSLKSLKTAGLAAFLFAGFFILMKFVYISHPFISGLIWSRAGAFLAAILLVFSKTVRGDILGAPKIIQEKTWLLVIPNEVLGGAAVFLQNWAIALAPFVYLGIISALEGTKYFFLLFFTTIISVKFPSFLKEEVDREVVAQKILAILFMGAGLMILALK